MNRELFIKFKTQNTEKDSVNANPIPGNSNSSKLPNVNTGKHNQPEITKNVMSAGL